MVGYCDITFFSGLNKGNFCSVTVTEQLGSSCTRGVNKVNVEVNLKTGKMLGSKILGSNTVEKRQRKKQSMCLCNNYNAYGCMKPLGIKAAEIPLVSRPL